MAEPPSDRPDDRTPDFTPPADPTEGERTRGIGAAEGPGDTIDRYRLLQQIGEGGFGVVFLAEQQEPVRRKVALKVIKLGMDTRQVIARFEAERQALAMMDHPGIAKVLDAGATAAGRPYFVMELVKGEPITGYCDKHQLGLEERLMLFKAVCLAVQHAHQKGIIHRDLKPSNVLVTLHDGNPVPKVIDFGIAKATHARLTEKTVFTELRQLVGTPVYMSPEQAEMTGLDIDTRSDIYSLGVLLYELMTGVTPFDAKELASAGYGELQRIIREETPPRPSTRLTTLAEELPTIATRRRTEPKKLGLLIRGDLDWIVMKALEKDRTRRYETANGLAMDIQRYLDDEPVTASPPSASYRLRKLVRRHRGAFAAAAALTVVLLAGIAGTSWGLMRALEAEEVARRERDEARRQGEIAEAVNEFLNDDLLSAVAPSSRAGRGRDVSMREVLDQASERIAGAAAPGGRFGDKPTVEAEVRETLARTYRALGDFDAAEPHLVRAVALREGEAAQEPLKLADALFDLGYLRFFQGRYDEAEAAFARSLAVCETLPGDNRDEVVAVTGGLALVYREQGRTDEAERLFLEVIAHRRAGPGGDGSEALVAMNHLANLYQTVGRHPESEALNREILEIQQRTLEGDDPAILATLNNLANAVASQGRLAEASDLLERVLEMKNRILGPRHPNTLNTLNNLADVDSLLGKWPEAERGHRETLALRREVLGPRHPRTAYSLQALAYTLTMQGRHEEGRRLAAEAAEIFRTELGADHVLTRETELGLAICLLGLGRAQQSAEILRPVAEFMERESQDEEGLARSRAYLGLALARVGRRDEAEALLRQALPKLPRWAAETPILLERAREITGADFGPPSS